MFGHEQLSVHVCLSTYVYMYVFQQDRRPSRHAGMGGVCVGGRLRGMFHYICLCIYIYLSICLSIYHLSTDLHIYIYICIRERTSLFAESIASILQPSALNRKNLVNPKHSPNATLIPEPPNLQTLTPNPEQKLLSLYRRGEALRVGRCDGLCPKSRASILRRF